MLNEEDTHSTGTGTLWERVAVEGCQLLSCGDEERQKKERIDQGNSDLSYTPTIDQTDQPPQAPPPFLPFSFPIR